MPNKPKRHTWHRRCTISVQKAIPLKLFQFIKGKVERIQIKKVVCVACLIFNFNFVAPVDMLIQSLDIPS